MWKVRNVTNSDPRHAHASRMRTVGFILSIAGLCAGMVTLATTGTARADQPVYHVNDEESPTPDGDASPTSDEDPLARGESSEEDESSPSSGGKQDGDGDGLPAAGKYPPEPGQPSPSATPSPLPEPAPAPEPAPEPEPEPDKRNFRILVLNKAAFTVRELCMEVVGTQQKACSDSLEGLGSGQFSNTFMDVTMPAEFKLTADVVSGSDFEDSFRVEGPGWEPGITDVRCVGIHGTALDGSFLFNDDRCRDE